MIELTWFLVGFFAGMFVFALLVGIGIHHTEKLEARVKALETSIREIK